MRDTYTPGPEHRFTFGLGALGHTGHDLYGAPTRSQRLPAQLVAILAEEGAWGINLYDDDLLPLQLSASDRDKVLRWFRASLETHGLCVPMVSANLHSDPVFRDGALSSHDPDVRAYALQKSMFALDLAAELGAETFLCWAGREGCETDAGKSPGEALNYLREGINFLCLYAQEQEYRLRIAIEPRPHDPRVDLYLPTTGAVLAFLGTLDFPDMVGVSPNTGHAAAVGLNANHALARAWSVNKLFHVSLSDQRAGRSLEGARFGSVNPRAAFFQVRSLETLGYTGPKQFTAHLPRTQSASGLRPFARGCMRTYLILREKVYRFSVDSEIQALLDELHDSNSPWAGVESSWSPHTAYRLLQARFDLQEMSRRALAYEHLDQLVTELLLGVR